MTSINDISDLVRIIRDDPGWAEVLRGVLLGQELLQLPEQFAEFVKLTNANFNTFNHRLELVETEMTGLRTEMTGLRTEMEEGFRAVNGRLDNLAGLTYEHKVEKNIRTIASQHLGIRYARARKGPLTGFPNDLADAFDQARENGIITPEESDELDRLDLILRGTDMETGERINVAIEVSITIGDNDVERAATRAGILALATGEPAIAAAVGARIDETRTTLASERGVRTALTPE